MREGSLAYGTSPWQRVDLYTPHEGPAGRAVVFYHGGFWRHDRLARDHEPLAAALVARGCAVAAVEYRPTWDGGQWPAAAEDAAEAWQRLADADPLWREATVAGHSAGAHLALAALAGRGVGRHALLLAPVVDMAHAAELGVGAGAVGHFLAGHLASGGTAGDATPRPSRADLASLTVVTAECDQAVPGELTRSQLAGWAAAGLAPDHHPVPGARHMHLVNPERGACTTVLERLAGPAPVREESAP